MMENLIDKLIQNPIITSYKRQSNTRMCNKFWVQNHFSSSLFYFNHKRWN